MALTQVTGPYPIFTDLDGSPLDDGYLYIGAINEDPEQNPIQVYWDSALTIPATQPIRTSNGYAYRNGTPALIYTAGAFSITIRNKREEFVLYSPVGYGFDPAAVSGAIVQNDFTGDGTTVNFTLSAAPSTKLATSVFINGVYQEKSTYSVTGNVLTFTVAPPLSSGIEVMTNETGVIGSTNATLVSYTAGFAGAVAQTVQTKLEQYISVKDFGAVGDGVADDTAEIQAALTAGAGRAVYFPGGTYLISATLTVPADTMVTGDGYGSVVYQGAREINVFNLNNNCTVQHLRLRGDGVSSGSLSFQLNNGIYAVSKRNIKILNCFIHSFEINGIILDDCDNIIISNNYLWDNKYSSSTSADIILYGLVGGSARVNITKNFCFSNNSQAIYVDAIGGDRETLVEGNICVALDPITWAEISSASLLRRHGIFFGYNGGGGSAIIANNLCRNTRQTGIYYQGNTASTKGVQILGNQCSRNGITPYNSGLASGIFIATQGSGDLIADNLVEDFADTSLFGNAGITVTCVASSKSSTPHTVLRNNIVRSSLSYGILMTGQAKNVDVCGNTIVNSLLSDIAWYPSAGFADVGNHVIKDNRTERTNVTSPSIVLDYQDSVLSATIENNVLLGLNNTTNSADNVGIRWAGNPKVYVRNNMVSNFYYGAYQASYLTGRAFSQQFIDRNTFIDCNVGIMISSATTAGVIPIQDNVFINVTTKTSGAALGAFTAAYIAQRFDNNIYFQNTAVPTIGTWIVGDRAQQKTPVVGQPKGWMCTVAGNPGTWVSEGNL